MRRPDLQTILLAAVLLLMLPFAAAAQENIIHLVRPGETLSSIARLYGVNPGAIINANGLPNPDRIYIGQRLTIPGVPGGHEIVHVVGRGETLSTIARLYGIDPMRLAAFNGLANPNLIYIGQRLRIPMAAPLPQPTPTPQPGAPVPTATPIPPPTPHPTPVTGCRCEEIVIATPAQGITVTNPVTVVGLAAGFEQTVVVSILDGSGGQIGLGPGTIVGPYGQQGTFTATVPFAVPANNQWGRIQVYTVSPRDGAIEHLASVTVMLQGTELDPLLEQLERAIAAKDYRTLERLMSTSFQLVFYRGESTSLTPAQAREQLERSYLGPGSPRLDFSVDAQALLATRVKLDPAITHVVFSTGWGASQKDEAFLLIGNVADRARWTGLLYVRQELVDYR